MSHLLGKRETPTASYCYIQVLSYKFINGGLNFLFLISEHRLFNGEATFLAPHLRPFSCNLDNELAIEWANWFSSLGDSN